MAWSPRQVGDRASPTEKARVDAGVTPKPQLRRISLVKLDSLGRNCVREFGLHIRRPVRPQAAHFCQIVRPYGCQRILKSGNYSFRRQGTALLEVKLKQFSMARLNGFQPRGILRAISRDSHDRPESR